MNKIIKGNLEAIDQLVDFLRDLTDGDYNYTHGTILSSSIGQHLRHILDLYHVLMASSQGELVDYDIRRRGAALEKDRGAGLKELAEVRQWITELTGAQLQAICKIKTEVMLSDSSSIETESSIGRELCFVSSHLTHHLALMAVLAKLAGCQVDESLGVAPATATFLRTQKTEKAAS